MASDTRGPLDLQFTFGPFPVSVEPLFWVSMAALGAYQGIRSAPEALAWVGVCFVCILVHELGHALSGRAFGRSSYIRLHGLGGSCHSDRELSRWRDVLVSAAGPGAGFLFGGLVVLGWHLLRPTGAFAATVYEQLKWVNFGWGVFNLLPVLPLDGGRIFAGLLGPTRRRGSYLVGTLTAVVLTALALRLEETYTALFFAYLTYQNGQAFLAEQAAPRVRKVAPVAVEPEALPRGWAALSAGELHEAGRLAHAALVAARKPAPMNAARDLLAWVALAEGDVRAALAQLEKVSPAGEARSLTWALALEAAQAPARALPHALRALEREPGDTAAALAVRLLTGEGQYEHAARLCETHAWRSPAVRDSQRASVAAAQGELALAAALHASAFESGGRAADAYAAASGHAHQGQLEQAAHWLKRALDAGFDDLEQLASAPELEPVRTVPEIAARLGAAPTARSA
jgi:Zn-dependent protease